jgi:hypothetical protein
LVWATRGGHHRILVDEIQDSITPEQHFQLREEILLPTWKGIHIFLKCLRYVQYGTRYWCWKLMLDMPLVLPEKHCRMDRERVQVWYPLEGPTFNKDLVGLVLVAIEGICHCDSGCHSKTAIFGGVCHHCLANVPMVDRENYHLNTRCGWLTARAPNVYLRRS